METNSTYVRRPFRLEPIKHDPIVMMDIKKTNNKKFYIRKNPSSSSFYEFEKDYYERFITAENFEVVKVIDLENIQQHYRPETVQLVGKDKREKFKVESITIVESQGDKMNCVLVTDNDGLNSELLTISIDFH